MGKNENRERLQKIIAAAGLTSRRKAELFIHEGRVTVNGRVVTELGTKADPVGDHIKVDGRLIRPFPEKVYVLLNKPRDVLSSMADARGRAKVTDLVRVKAKIYPVGRLDYKTEGLMLLTNDGAFARIIAKAGSHFPKVYEVKVRGVPGEAALNRLRAGMRLGAGVQLRPCRIVPLQEENNAWFEVTLTEGRNRQIREMFAEIGHPVAKLKRTRIGFFTCRGLARGQYRFLSGHEIARVLETPRRVEVLGKRRGRNVACR